MILLLKYFKNLNLQVFLQLYSSKQIGVDIIELDVHLTKDEHVVVAHDNNLSRIAGVNNLISNLNYDVINITKL